MACPQACSRLSSPAGSLGCRYPLQRQHPRPHCPSMRASIYAPRPAVMERIAWQQQPKDLLLTLPTAPSTEPWRTRMLPLQVEHSVVKALLAACHEHGVTLHTLLAVASLMGARTVLSARRARLRLSTPVSLRERCRPPATGLGVFISSIDTDLTLSEQDELWQVAQHVKHDLTHELPECQRSVGLLEFAGDLTALARKFEQQTHGRTATVEVSNIGTLQDLPEGTAMRAPHRNYRQPGVPRLPPQYVPGRNSSPSSKVLPAASKRYRKTPMSSMRVSPFRELRPTKPSQITKKTGSQTVRSSAT